MTILNITNCRYMIIIDKIDDVITKETFSKIDDVIVKETFDKINDIIAKETFENTYAVFMAYIRKNGIELWKTVERFPRYEVSTNGQVRILTSNRNGNNNVNVILKPKLTGGYHRVMLKNDTERKSILVHVLVAQLFIPNNQPITKNEVDHINRNKIDNKVNNLRWVTHQENMTAYAKTIIYVGKKIYQLDLDGNLIKEWNNIREILEAHPEYSYDSLLHCLGGQINKLDKLYGFRWKYEDKKEVELKNDEIFKNIGTFKGLDFTNFEISSYGNVRNIKRNNILSGKLDENGYKRVCLTINQSNGKGKYIKIHQLVATYFIGNPPSDKHMVNHKDKNRSNNYFGNLEWVIHQKNVEHACGRKIQQINKDTGEVIKEFNSIQAACVFNKFKQNSHVSISQCCRGKRKAAFGYKWKYIDE